MSRDMVKNIVIDDAVAHSKHLWRATEEKWCDRLYMMDREKVLKKKKS